LANSLKGVFPVANTNQNTVVITITSATFGVKHGSTVIYGPVSCVVTDNIVTRPSITESVTQDWGKQSYTWDIRCVIDGVSKTWVKGQFVMLRSEQEV